MRIAIIAPPYPLEEAPAPPLGVTYVAAACDAAGAKVRIFDYIVAKYSPEKLRAQLAEFNPQVAGITSVTLNFRRAAEIISQVKLIRPEIVTLMGGPHVSFMARETLDDYPGIDIIVIGEGEATLGELLPLIHERDRWEGVRGIAFRRDGRTVFTPPRELIADLDALPLPARHLLPLSRYQALGYSISIITGRGCPYRCIFCVGRRMVGNKVRLRSPALVVDEIEQILSYGITRINVADDLFVSRKARVLEVCSEIGRRGLRFDWSAFARVNTVDRETLAAMREAGCDSVSFGVESGNQDILDRIGKRITKDMVREAVSLCKETGIIPHTSFMVGLPGETRETLAETRAFAAGLGSLYGYHFLSPFPGTTVRDRVVDYDLEILTEDWNRYDANSAIVRTKALTPEEMNAFVADYDREIQTAWEEMQVGYKKTNSPEIDLQVRGYFRTGLVYRLLSEDIIENSARATGRNGGGEAAEADIQALCQNIQLKTNLEYDLIEETIRSFLKSGYIKAGRQGDRLFWHWTFNRFTDSQEGLAQCIHQIVGDEAAIDPISRASRPEGFF